MKKRHIFIPGVETYSKKRKMWVKGNVPSQKNSMMKTSRGIFPSKLCQQFIKQSSVYFHRYYDDWARLTERIPEGEPMHVTFTFARSTKKTFDFHNALQVLGDCMSGHHFWKTDKNGVYLNVYPGVRNPKFNPKRVKWLPQEGYTGEDRPFDPMRLKWLVDDDYKNFHPHFNKVILDPVNPGVYIHVFPYRKKHSYDY